MTADLTRIAEATDLGVLARSYGLKLTRAPGGFSARCPFHEEKSASLRIHTAGRYKGKFKCFGCAAGGDCYQFVQQLENVSFPEAVRRLASDAGIELNDRPETPAERQQRFRERERRAMCAWYFREEWKKARRGLNQAIAANPHTDYAPIAWDMKTGEPSGGQLRSANLAAQLADFYGGRLRWIEANRETEAGMREFLASKVPHSAYRAHLAQAEKIREAQMAFAELILSKVCTIGIAIGL